MKSEDIEKSTIVRGMRQLVAGQTKFTSELQELLDDDTLEPDYKEAEARRLIHNQGVNSYNLSEVISAMLLNKNPLG